MASFGVFQSGLGEDESIATRVTARRRSKTGASTTLSLSGGGEPPESRRSASKRLKTPAAEGSKETGLTVLPASDSKSGKQVAKHHAQLDADIWSQLDDYLQTTIIATLPFQQLFQASSLSQTWRLRFLSDPLFQSDVRSSSTASWESYSPVHVIHKKGLVVGYEGSSQRCCQLPPYSYLPVYPTYEWHLRAVDGSLFCWVGEPFDHRGAAFRPVLVGNPLTKSWNHLPPQPDGSFPYFVHVLRECEACKVLLCTTINIADKTRSIGSTISVGIQIFDSTDGSWNVESYFAEEEGYVELPGGREGGSAVINGVLYMLFYHWKDVSRLEFNFMLISLDLKTKVFTETTLLQRVFSALTVSSLSQLVVCRSNLMLVMKENDLTYEITGHHLKGRRRSNGTLIIFWFDLEHLAIIEVSQAPKNMLDKHCLQARYRTSAGAFGENLTVAACNGDSIHIGNHKPLHTSLCYNVGTQEWHSVNSAPAVLSVHGGEYPTWDWEWSSITFQPGLDPFLEV